MDKLEKILKIQLCLESLSLFTQWILAKKRPLFDVVEHFPHLRMFCLQWWRKNWKETVILNANGKNRLKKPADFVQSWQFLVHGDFMLNIVNRMAEWMYVYLQNWQTSSQRISFAWPYFTSILTYSSQILEYIRKYNRILTGAHLSRKCSFSHSHS